MARKGKAGTGSFYERPDGYWYGSVMIDRKRFTSSGKTLKAAQASLKVKIEAATAPAPGVAVGPFLDQWLRDSARRRVSASTLERYEQVVRVHLKPGLGDILVPDLRPVQVEQFLDGLKSVGPRTRWQIRAVLRTALNYAIKAELATMNAAALADPPRLHRRTIQPLTVDQARAFLAATTEDPLHALYVMALWTGMRQGELLGLRWSDVDLDEGVASIRRGIRRVGGKVREIPTKTKRSTRDIALMPVVVEALGAHQERQRDVDRDLAGARWAHQGHVFTSSLGTPMDSSLFNSRRWRPLRAAAGLPKTFQFHHLRHTTASLLLDAGVPMAIVSEILGHTAIGITVNTYGHISIEAQRRALAALPL